MPITNLPTPPTRSDPVNFNSRADAFLAALPTFATEANTLQNDVNAKQTAAATSAANALASENAAAANSGATIWVSGTTYAIGNVRFSPVNFLSYRRKTAGAGTTDPSADGTNWQLINGTGNVDLSSTQTLTNKTFSTGSVWNGSAVPIANGGTGAVNANDAFANIKQAASETISGVVELSSTTELATGVDSSTAITPAVLRATGIVKAASVNPGGSVALDFVAIPSWVTRITICFRNISTSGTSPILVRVGNSSSFLTTDYSGSGSTIGASTASSVLATSGFQIGAANSEPSTHNGFFTLVKFTNDVWHASTVMSLSDTAASKISSGTVSISNLNRVRITTVNGTDTFDSGGVVPRHFAILWE